MRNDLDVLQGVEASALVGYDDTSLYFALKTNSARIARKAKPGPGQDHATLEIAFPGKHGEKGRVHSVDWFVSIGLAPLSFALTGPVSSALGVDTTLIIAGGDGVLSVTSFGAGRPASSWPATLTSPDRPRSATRSPSSRVSVPMEPNGIVVTHDGDGIVCYIPTQAAHGVRHTLANAFGIDEDRIRPKSIRASRMPAHFI